MAAAELKLQVGLDLAFFRQQLAQLGTVAVGYQMPINIKFDRLSIQQELNKLGANISKRTYRLEVATNIAAEIKNAGTLAKALRGLDNAIQKNKGVANRAGGGAAGSVVDASKLEKSLKTATKPVLESVYNEMNRLGIRMAKAANDAGKTTNESLRAAILSGIPQVTADMAQGLAKGINPLMKVNGQKGAKLFIEAWKDAAGIASPSKVFKALGEFSADGLEIGFINGLKDFKSKSVDEIRKIVALLKLELAKISDVSMAPAMSRSAGGRGSRGYMSPIGPLPHGSKEPWAFSEGRYQPFMAQPGQARGAGASRAGGPSIMGTTSSPSMFGASFPALPSAGMTGGGGAYRQAQLQSRTAGAYARSAAREASVLGESQMYARVSGQVPLGNTAPRLPSGNQGGALALRSAPSGGRGGFGSFGGLGGAMANVSLPRAGIVSELGGEFAMAAKQVLLFGTAYKALAFLTDFPSKVGEAVAQLQTFRNTLQAITPNADEFQKSNQFILDTVDKYNTPLQSARDGFTNLYASMAPAGFKGDEIRNIFSGVSQAAATFGMSADKVDRVNYAFAQMASKGQVMSEELKGQLGDVLPGSVAIFAKAAGFTGPNAMVEFTKAMEAGRYKGEAMKQLLINVGIVMKDKFAKGAEGAAQNFQGQMNAMANATKNLYEAFEPAGNLFSSKIIAPFTQGLAVITDGFNAFFSGTATKTAGGFALSKELEKLRPSFDGIATSIKQLLPTLQAFAATALGLGKILLQIAANPFIGYLARVYLAVLPLTIAIQALNLQALIPMIGSLLRAIPAFIAFSTAAWNGASRTVALRIAMQATGQTATIAGGQVALLSNTLKTAFVGTVVGAVVIGIGMIIERIMTLGSKMEEAKGNALRLQDSIKGMSKTELQVEENKLGKQGALLQGLQREAGGQKYALLNKQQEEMVMNLAPGSITRVAKAGKGRNKLVEVASGLKAIGGGLAAIDVTMLPAIEQKIQSLRQNIDSARLTLNASDQNTSLNLAPIPGAGDDTEAAAKAKTLYENQKAYADKLSAAQTEADIKRQTTRFDNEKSMINMAYDLREARANSFEKETIRFQKELFNIEMTRQKAVMDANNEITKAQGKVAGGTGGIGGMNEGAAGLTSYITGDPSQKGKGYQPDHGTVEQYHDHLAFATRELAIQAYNKLTAADIKVTEFKGYGKGVTGPHSGAGSLHHQGLAMDVPGYQWGGTGAIGAKDYAGSARVRQVMGIGDQSNTGGKISASQSRAGLAAQAERNALQNKTTKLTLAEVEAVKQAEIATANYVASIMPAAEQELQNKLLQRRTELMRTGITPGQIDTEMRIYEAQAKQSEGLKAFSAKVETLNKLKEKNGTLSKEDQDNLNLYNAIIKELTKNMSPFTKSVRDGATATRDLAYEAAKINLGDRLKMAQAFTPEAEMRVRIKQQNPEATESQLGDLFKTEQTATKAEELKTQMQGVASTIGDAFSTAFQGIINGSMSVQDALGGMFKSIGESFVKMAAEIIAKQIVLITLGFIMKALGLIGGIASAGNAAGAAAFSPSNAAGFDAIPGQAFSLPQLSGTMIDGGGIGATAFAGPLAGGFAKGGAFSNGVRRFATGGIVNGPTLFPFADGGAMQMGLMGEAGPEAIMPLQRGADGSLGVRAAMGGNGMGGSSSSVLNMSFETSTINGVEYVSRDQLELAMAQTRRQASRDGANKGMAMTLDKIQQSPQTRRRIGM